MSFGANCPEMTLTADPKDRSTKGIVIGKDSKKNTKKIIKDYFIERNGEKFAGIHLFIDFWGAKNLDRIEVVKKSLCDAAKKSGATILHCHLHRFASNNGISGVLVLAESHISIHTWPERDFAALDIFMCGECDPYQGVSTLKEAFSPVNMVLSEKRRGQIK